MIEDTPLLDRGKIAEKFVALVDILGFSSRVQTNFDQALETFERVLRSTDVVRDIISSVELRVYSDSFLLISDKLQPIVAATQALQMQTLFNDYLVRGGIAHGRHIDVSDAPHLLMVSEAVVKAARIEQSVRFPCVALHPDIPVEDAWWVAPVPRNLERGLLYFGGLTIVNPCNVAWGQSAATRVWQMLEEHPEHREKYEWFLELHQAIFSPVPMVPPRFFAARAE